MFKKNQNGFAHLFLFILILVVISAIGFIGYQTYQRSNSRHVVSYYTGSAKTNSGQQSGGNNPVWNSAQNGEITLAENLPSCKGTDLFSAAIADLSAIEYIDPLGHTSSYNGNSQHVIPVDHMYFNFRHSQAGNFNSPTVSAAVFSPGDLEVFQIKEVTYLQNNTVTGHDYTLYMAPCKEVTVYLGHIDTINQNLQNALAQVTSDNKYCQPDFVQDITTFRPCTYSLLTNLKAGEQIGTAGGPGVSTQAFDFGVYDMRNKPLAFIDQKYWTPENLHTVCGLSYYADGAIKTSQFQKIKNTKLTNGLPDCGSNMWDKAGTIQGNWVLPGTPTGPVPDVQGLAIVPYNNDPSHGDIDWGGTIAPADRITFKMTSTGLINRDPSQVTADGNVYCSSDGYKAISLQLIDSNTIKVEAHNGNCPAVPNLTSPTTYVR